MPDYGLGILSGLLGGAGKGLYEGYSGGIADQQKAAQLAEQQRQFNEGNFTPTNELPIEYGGLVQPGTTKIRNTLIPTYEKRVEQAQSLATQKQQQDYFSRAAEDPNLDPDTRALFKMMAAPGFGGPQATMGTALSNMGKITPHSTVGVGPEGGDAQNYVYGTDRKGNIVNPPTPLGIKQPPSRQSFNRDDIEKALVEAGWVKDEPGWAEAYANVARQIPVSGVGVYGAGQFVIPPPPRNQPQPKPTSRVTPPGGLPAKPLVSTEQPLSPAESTNLADFRTLLGQLDRVSIIYNNSSQYTGPVQGRIGALRNLTGIGATGEEATLRAELASIQNSIIYLKSGKQINEAEFARLKAELPLVTDPEPVFNAKLTRAKALLTTMMENRQREFAARGFRGSSAPAAPYNVGRETLSRGDTRYQQLRSRGMTDQAITQKYNVDVVD
jgi:hypothetical protein